MTREEQIQKLDAMAKPRSEKAIAKAKERKERRNAMIQEQKQLLLKDLCGRLPHGVKVLDDMGRTYTLAIGTSYLIDLFYSNGDYVDAPIKPYLRPMSSMTEDEKKEYQSLCEIHIEHDADDNITYYYFDTIESFDWLNKNMFDYRGLIPRSCAIAVTEDNNPYKD